MNALAKAKGWKVHHLDVKTTILSSHLQEEVFMQQPQGYEQLGFISFVCKFNHALYGLKQSPLEWLHKIDNFLKHNHMNKSSSNGNLYYL
jgi:hypothetical protein